MMMMMMMMGVEVGMVAVALMMIMQLQSCKKKSHPSGNIPYAQNSIKAASGCKWKTAILTETYSFN
jgi:hypothetical protein